MGRAMLATAFRGFLERLSASTYWIYAFLLLLLGLFLDASGVVGTWFPRSGAFLAGSVAFAYFYDLRNNDAWFRAKHSMMLNEKEDAEAPLRDARSEAKLMKVLDADPTVVANHKNEAFLATRPHVKEVRETYVQEKDKARSAVRAQGWVIMLGTFVWGFGDFLSSYLNCGAIEC